jgi:hypothetical protein
MDRFDEVVNDIKGAWVATHKTVKEVKYEYSDYFFKTDRSDLCVIWKEKNPERIAKQIHDLIVEMAKLGHEARLHFIETPYDSDGMYMIEAIVNYTERYD